MKKISLFFILTCLLLSTTTAYAADNVVDYWTKIMNMNLQAESLQPDMKAGTSPIKMVDKSIATAKKMKKDLVQMQPPVSLQTVQKKQVEGATYLIGGLESLKNVYTKQEKWRLMLGLEKMKKGMLLFNAAEKELLVVCKQTLIGQKNLSFREKLCLYWTDTREKEAILTESVERMMDNSMQLLLALQNGDSAGVDKILASFGELQRDMQNMGEELATYHPTEPELSRLHEKKVKLVDGVNQLLSTFNKAIQANDMQALGESLLQVDDLIAAEKEYNDCFQTLLRK